jgi:hypothetical protein
MQAVGLSLEIMDDAGADAFVIAEGNTDVLDPRGSEKGRGSESFLGRRPA